MMGRTGHAHGILSPGSPEDLRHRFFFGVSAEVAVKVCVYVVFPPVTESGCCEYSELPQLLLLLLMIS